LHQSELPSQGNGPIGIGDPTAASIRTPVSQGNGPIGIIGDPPLALKGLSHEMDSAFEDIHSQF
jgi:hypothetical protein